MFEFCLSINCENKDLFCYINDTFNNFATENNYIYTFNKKQNITDFLFACNVFEKARLICFLQGIICEIVCYYFKKDFLSERIKINTCDDGIKKAFMYSLLFFDKETDKYIVCKKLNLKNKINVNGYFDFCLQNLKSKWAELVSIANENSLYLYSSETFLELVRFLIDNIEIKSNEVDIVEKEHNIVVSCEQEYDFNIIEQGADKMEEVLAKLIAYCPKCINIYCGDIMDAPLKDLICKLFDTRVKFFSKV